MQTQAYFEDIQQHILIELEKAKSSIQIAVAWFTDINLFSSLCNKANSGIAVELMLMNDEINNSSGINYDLLCNAGGKVWKIGDKNKPDRLMRNKFCIIDNKTVINGSYNWTNKARQNHESITIITENIEFALQFNNEFRAIKENYFGKDVESTLADYGIICSRLITLRESIRTGDVEDIGYLTSKLKKHIKPFTDSNISKIHKIVEHIEKKRYVEAVSEINEFVDRFQALTVFIDTEIAALRLELRALELQISSLEDEKIELEKLLHEFEVRHNQELGEILLKLLRLRKDKLKEEAKQNPEKENEYKEAEKDYKNYHKSHEELKDERIIELTDEQKKELKTIYRSASKLCHPDAVDAKFKKEAEEIFKELNDAYQKNDIEKVKQIYENLKKGAFKSGSETTNEKQELLKKVARLRLVRDKIENTVQNIKQSSTYQQIIKIDNWDEYFSNVKKELLKELNKLEGE